MRERTVGVRVFRMLTSAITLSVVVATGESCSSCEAKCIGPGAEFFVASDVGSIEVCDSAGTCTAREFNGGFRTFVISTSHERDTVSMDVRTFLADGTPGVSGRVEAKPPGGGSESCGCKGLVRIDVSASKIAAS